MFTNAYKNVLAVGVATDYSFPQAEKVKEYLKDPGIFAVAAAPVAAAASGGAPAVAAVKEEPVIILLKVQQGHRRMAKKGSLGRPSLVTLLNQLYGGDDFNSSFIDFGGNIEHLEKGGQ